MEFDAEEGDQLTIPASEEFKFEEFTLEAWVRPDEARELAPVVADTTTGPRAGPGYALFAGGDGHKRGHPEGFTTEGDLIGYAVEREEPLTDDTWTHLAMTYDGATVKLYVDGELVDTTAAPGGSEFGEGELQIGGDEPWDEGGFFDGRIDELRVYDRALAAGEVVGSMVPLPIAQTNPPQVVEGAEAVLRGVIHAQGLKTEYEFQYGKTAAYATSAPEVVEKPILGTKAQEVEEVIEGLEPETTYHYRLVAWNQAGTSVGADRTLTNGPAGTSARNVGAGTVGTVTSGRGFVNIGWSGDDHKTAQSPMMEEIKGSGAKMLRFVVPAVNEEAENVFRLAAERGITNCRT